MAAAPLQWTGSSTVAAVRWCLVGAKALMSARAPRQRQPQLTSSGLSSARWVALLSACGRRVPWRNAMPVAVLQAGFIINSLLSALSKVLLCKKRQGRRAAVVPLCRSWRVGSGCESWCTRPPAAPSTAPQAQCNGAPARVSRVHQGSWQQPPGATQARPRGTSSSSGARAHPYRRWRLRMARLGVKGRGSRSRPCSSSCFLMLMQCASDKSLTSSGAPMGPA